MLVRNTWHIRGKEQQGLNNKRSRWYDSSAPLLLKCRHSTGVSLYPAGMVRVGLLGKQWCWCELLAVGAMALTWLSAGGTQCCDRTAGSACAARLVVGDRKNEMEQRVATWTLCAH